MLVGGLGGQQAAGEMLDIMCQEKGARFFLPARKFMGDNGSMIAYTGLAMMKSGVVTSLAESKVRPGYRTDDVEVRWGYSAEPKK